MLFRLNKYSHNHCLGAFWINRLFFCSLQVVPSGLATMTKLEELQLYGNNFSKPIGTQSISLNAVGRRAVLELQSRIKEL
jgi:hypothetical protein